MRYTIFLVVLLFSGCVTEDYLVPNHVPGIVRVHNEQLFVAYGEGGLFITDISTNEVLAHIIPTGEMKGIDDFSVDGDLLFALDARGQDYLAVYSISDIRNPVLLKDPVNVQGGPFNGVSAKAGNVVVSGGTAFFEYYRYTSDGELEGPATFGRDRGHPDVLLSEDGQVAFASTDFAVEDRMNGVRFGILALSLGQELNIPTIISQLPLPGAGFTQGQTSPVGFAIQSETYNDHLLVAHGGGLTIAALIEGSAFGQNQLFDLGIEAISVVAENGIAYITGYNTGPVLLKVDISDIFNPTIIETVSLNVGENIPTAIALSDQEIFIAAGNRGLLRFNK